MLVRPFSIVIILAIFSELMLGCSVPLPETALAQTAASVFVGAGDIATCGKNTQDEATAQLLDNIPGTVFTLGDNAYPDGTLTQFTDCYGSTWGRHKDRTRPSPGNHEYHTVGAAGYYTYFSSVASPLDVNCTKDCKGYYSYNLGAWHIIALNSEINHAAGSAQEKWLRTDLATNQSMCTLAYWHKPRFSSGRHGNISDVQPFWQALYDYGADVVLNGHDHTYERFALQNPNGQADPTHGIREFVVGTGGGSLYSFPSIQANSEVRNNTTWGVLKLTLHPASYDWEYIPIAGKKFTDTGSTNCVSVGIPPMETRTSSKLGPIATSTDARTSITAQGLSDKIFADDYESGDLSAWTSSKIDGDDLSVSESAAMVGRKGMQVVIDDNNSIYVTDDQPTSNLRYRAHFYFDPNSITMADGDDHYIFHGFTGTSVILRVEFRKTSGNYHLRARLLDDGSTWTNTKWFIILDAPHYIDLDWRTATAAGANNGGLKLWIDGVQQADLTGVDNDTRWIDRIRLGAVAGIDTGTRGTYYFDAFESRW